MAKVGDIVRFLNDVGGGRITKIKDNIAYVDDDGFETPVLIRECVVVQSVDDAPKPAREAVVAPKPAPEVPSKSTDPEPEEEEFEEVPGGDVLNVVLGFEATDLKHLSSSDYDAYIVNDSNYYLYFNFASRADEADGWTTRYAGVVEPNIQLLLGTFNKEEVAQFDRISLQYIAFKRDKEYAQKNPASVEFNVDTTKFFKLHCFRENTYFENPAITFDVVRNDVANKIDPLENIALLQREMQRKKDADARPVRRKVSKPAQGKGETIVVDLHIHELVDNTHGLSSADMLNLQVDKFREVMDANLKNHGQKIVFIHGKGEGVLRQAITKELNYRYKKHDVQDASFQEYGYGATQVTIR
jgi:hypothetical protein